MRGAPAERPAVEERQKSGLGKYASSGTERMKDDVRHPAIAPLGVEQCLQLRLRRSGDRSASPIAMKCQTRPHPGPGRGGRAG
ncbi:hypothetical protein SALBM311S_00665 [Streptomyces alboniger]